MRNAVPSTSTLRTATLAAAFADEQKANSTARAGPPALAHCNRRPRPRLNEWRLPL